jgi:hypothetical protein
VTEVGAEYRIYNQKPHHRQQGCIYLSGGETGEPYRRVVATEGELSLRINRFEKLEPSTFHSGGDIIEGTGFAYC